MAIIFEQILRRERERFLFSLAACAQAGDKEAFFRELDRLRRSIPQLIRRHAVELDRLESSELQMQLHRALDDSLKTMVERLIEIRARDFAEHAQRDVVTGLFNRAAFERRCNDEIERARRYGRSFSLIIFDLDHFKSINDRFGHPAGDQALRQTALILQSALRRSDSAFRYGGDEFIAICPETRSDAALALIHRIESSFQNSPLETGEITYTTISWGVASFPTDAQKMDELILVADRRLYECKKRNHQSIGARAK